LVEIRAIVKNARLRNPPEIVVTDDEIAASGGVTTLDRVVVAVVADDRAPHRIGGVVDPLDLECRRAFLRSRGTA